MPPLQKSRPKSVTQMHSAILETLSLKSGSVPLSPTPAPIRTATLTRGPAPPVTPGLIFPNTLTPLTDTCTRMSTPASGPPATGATPSHRGAEAATTTRVATTLLLIKPTIAIHSTRAITTTHSREGTTTAIRTREAATAHSREAATTLPEADTPTIITRRRVILRSGLLNTRATPESRRRRITQVSAHSTGRMTINGEYWSSGGEAKGA